MNLKEKTHLLVGFQDFKMDMEEHDRRLQTSPLSFEGKQILKSWMDTMIANTNHAMGVLACVTVTEKEEEGERK